MRSCSQVHPVGIGLSSWFWDRFIGEWRGGAVFTIDLIGCGDSDPWEPADEGMFIHGCCMEGARWDMKKGCIAESLAKDLHPPMPVINVKGMVYDLVDKTGIFDCPVYITTKRGATFTFVATLKTNEAVNKWVLAGVAIMMSDDIAVAG